MVEICRQFGWDYHTYLAQPIWFIKLILEMMKIETKKAEADMRKAKIKR